MALNAKKMVSAYLALWKILDIHFPGHQLSEVCEESIEEVTAQVTALLEDDLEWSDNPNEFRTIITRTLSMSREVIKDPGWFANAKSVKQSHQENAFKFAAMLPDPPVLFHIAKA